MIDVIFEWCLIGRMGFFREVLGGGKKGSGWIFVYFGGRGRFRKLLCSWLVVVGLVGIEVYVFCVVRGVIEGLVFGFG